jgi:hypothetical protein
MTAMGHEERFPSPRLNGRCRFGQATFGRPAGNGRGAPKAAIAARNSSTASPINDGPLLSPAGAEDRRVVEGT